MRASKRPHPEGHSGLLRLVTVGGSLVAIFAMVWTLRTHSWSLAAIYALLVLTATLGVSRSWIEQKASDGETPPLRDQRLVSVAYLAAILVQFSLKFYLEFSWLWSIVVALVVLVVVVVVEALLRTAGASVLNDPTWLFGNLPPLELKHPDRAGAQLSGLAGSMPQQTRDNLVVDINRQTFSLGDGFEAGRLALANFVECKSVALVRARAAPNQIALITSRCVAQSFGGEFTVATLMKENTPPSVMIVSTAFLYYGKRNPLEPLRLERIAVVVAGGDRMLGTITRGFAMLATEMLGESILGSRGQRIWEAGDLFLVLEEQEWKDLRRATIIWTSESLDKGGAR